MKFKDFVATGVSEEEVDRWIRENTTQKDPKAIFKCNNEMRGLRLGNLSEEVGGASRDLRAAVAPSA